MARPNPVARSGISPNGQSFARGLLIGLASVPLALMILFGGIGLAANVIESAIERVNASYQETLAPSGVRSAAMAAREGR